MSRRELVVLSTLSILSLLMVIFDPWERQPGQDSSLLLKDYDMEALSRIVYENETERFVSERSASEVWVAVEPEEGLVDANALRRIRSALRLLRSLRSARQLPQHGVEPGAPTLTLAFGSEGSLTLRLGTSNANGSTRWVGVNDANVVYLVESHLVADAVEGAASLRSPQLIPWVSARNESLRVVSEGRWMEVEGETLRWSPEVGVVHEVVADSSSLQSWLAALMRLERRTPPGCVHPTELRIAQGTSTAAILPSHCVDAEDWAIVHAVVEKPERLANMHLFPTRRPHEDFVIRCAEDELQVQLGNVDQQALRQWWSRWDRAPVELLEKRDFEVECSVETPDGVISIGRRAEARIASSPHRDFDYRLGDDDNLVLQPTSELFQSLILIQEDAIFLRSVELSGAGGNIELTRDAETGSWRSVTASSQVLDPDRRATELARVLGTLQAERFVQAGDASFATAPLTRLAVEFDSALGDSARRYDIEIRGDVGGCVAVVDGQRRAVLAADDCAVILR